jgi:hypothetical protein
VGVIVATSLLNPFNKAKDGPRARIVGFKPLWRRATLVAMAGFYAFFLVLVVRSFA